jgi:SecD/SecF fusion protein
MSGGVVTDAKDTFDQSGKPAVSMQMNGQGAKGWEELTGRAYTQKYRYCSLICVFGTGSI